MKTKLLFFSLILLAMGGSLFAQGTQIQKSTVANLPSAANNTNALFMVTDGANTSDCTVGGGSTHVICASNGAAWANVVACPFGTPQTITDAASINLVVISGCNITDNFLTLSQATTIAGVTGTIAANTEITLTVQQNGTGGWTLAFPGNFLNVPTIQSGANLTTAMTFQYCGAVGNGTACPAGDWQNTDIGPSGALPATPTTPNGATAVLACPISAGTCNAAWVFQGIVSRAVTGTTANDTIATGDCNNDVDYQTSVSVNPVTIPSATTLGVPGCALTLRNDTTGAGTTLNLSPSTWPMKINGGASVATYTLPKGYQAKFSVDAAGALWDVDVTQITPGGFVQTLNVTTDQTITAGASLAAIPGLSFTMPASMAVNVPFSCHLLYSQATAAASDSFGIQDVTVAPTNLMAKAQAYISASTFTAGNLPALTTTTATAIVTFTPSAAATVWNADIDGFIEQPSNASTSVVQIMAQFTTNNGTIKRGSFCTVGVPK